MRKITQRKIEELEKDLVYQRQTMYELSSKLNLLISHLGLKVERIYAYDKLMPISRKKGKETTK